MRDDTRERNKNNNNNQIKRLSKWNAQSHHIFLCVFDLKYVCRMYMRQVTTFAMRAYIRVTSFFFYQDYHFILKWSSFYSTIGSVHRINLYTHATGIRTQYFFFQWLKVDGSENIQWQYLSTLKFINFIYLCRFCRHNLLSYIFAIEFKSNWSTYQITEMPDPWWLPIFLTDWNKFIILPLRLSCK